MVFDFSAPIKKSKKNVVRTTQKIYDVIQKNVICVCSIHYDGNYVAISLENGKELQITSKSYHIKTKNYYCQQLVEGKRVQAIQLDVKEEFNTPWLYLPFAAGVGMVGNIVKLNTINSEIIMFDLTRTFDMPKTHPLAISEFLYYRDNYKNIYNNICKRYGRQPLYNEF